MSDPTPPRAPTTPVTPLRTTSLGTPGTLGTQSNDKVLCERCGEEMYRMHAVWRCSACGFKTDCCGW